MLVKFLHAFFSLLFKLLTRTTVEGYENVPVKGGAIIAMNHMSLVDAPLVFVAIRRTDATAMVAKKHQKNPLLRFLVDSVHGVWINREEADTQAIRASRQWLQEGHLLGIAPEGTRSESGALLEGKTGLVYLADKAGVPVIPMAVTGTDDGIKKIFTFQRPRIKLQIGKPIAVPPIRRETREEDLRRVTDLVMCSIAAMLPSDKWGFYASHPCLKEMLAAQQQK